MRDFLQAASNTAADTVAAPVDLIAFLLRKAGVPVPQNAVGGTQWMTERGLRRDVQQSPASLAGETVGLLSPVVAAAKAPQIAKGLLQVEANAAAPRTLRPEAGAIVWHGSPHKFDRFDASKIGTGEGAQAYGHGLYLAESPDVAGSYRIAGGHGNWLIDGNSAAATTVRSDSGPMNYAADALQRFDGDRQQAMEWLRNWGMEGEAKKILRKAKDVKKSDGSLYKVDLPDEKIARMLDWDKPLSQQPEAVAELATVFGLSPQTTGAQTYDALTKKFGTGVRETLDKAGQSSAASVLRQRGIPGIRYLDGGSRGAGAGTSNFVVFPGEEQFLRILERNGGLLGP